MKKILLLALVTFTVLSTSCNKDDDDIGISGKYETTLMTSKVYAADILISEKEIDKGGLIEQGDYYTLDFKSDGTVTYQSQGEEKGAGKWTQKDDVVTISSADDNLELKVDGNKLILEQSYEQTENDIKYKVEAKLYLTKM